MGELSGKVALVTGTAQGIGTAIANGLEEDGAKVHRVDRDTADLTNSAQVAKLIAGLGRVDILINNAGRRRRPGRQTPRRCQRRRLARDRRREPHERVPLHARSHPRDESRTRGMDR